MGPACWTILKRAIREQVSERTRLPKNGTGRRGRTEQNLIAYLSTPPFAAHYSPPCGQQLGLSEILPSRTVNPGGNAS